MGDTNAVEAAVPVLRRAVQERLASNKPTRRGGLIYQVPKMRSIFSRWRFVSAGSRPDVGGTRGPVEAGLMDRYVEAPSPNVVARLECGDHDAQRMPLRVPRPCPWKYLAREAWSCGKGRKS